MLFFTAMAAHLFNRIGQVGLGVALVGGVVNSALYNGNNYNIFFAIGQLFKCCNTFFDQTYFVLLLANLVSHTRRPFRKI